jgi:hypothetical protein
MHEARRLMPPAFGSVVPIDANLREGLQQTTSQGVRHITSYSHSRR